MEVSPIHPTFKINKLSVRLTTGAGPINLRNDSVTICAGGVLPAGFLTSLGIATKITRGEACQRRSVEAVALFVALQFQHCREPTQRGRTELDFALVQLDEIPHNR